MDAAELVWGLFPRALAIVYCIALGSLYGQVLPFAGAAGLRPLRKVLAKIAEDYPSWRRFFYFPTLFWLNQSDRFLRVLIWVGIACALLVIIGGALTPFYLLACWAIYLSFDLAVGLVYPWDTLLLEAGFLAIFLPPVTPLSQLTAELLPLPIVVFAYQFLLFRLIFGFGKFKFVGTNRKERLYLKQFLINQPLPSPLGWLAAHLPGWVWIGALGFLFLVEIILPFFIFLGGEFRTIAAFGIIGLMLGIQLMGNFGFFNLLAICLCITLFDTQLSLLGQVQAIVRSAFTSWQALIVNALLFVWALGALLYFPFNSWCTQSWVNWPSIVFVKPLWLRRLFAFCRALAPFRFFNAYGVFPPTSSPAVKWVPVFEGSHDGKRWRSYHYHFMPTEPNSPPRFIAPHHPRLDHSIFYEAFGTGLDNFLESLFSTADPYNFAHVSPVDSLAQGLLEGNGQIISLFGSNPFPTVPPKWIRVSCYLLAPTTIAEWRRTGNWWRKQWVGVHTPARTLVECTAHHYVDPELFHWDDIVWKRRSPRTRALMTADLPTLEALYDCADIELFWNRFIADLAYAQADWSGLSSLVITLRARYTARQLQLFEKLFAQLGLLLYAQLEAHTTGEAEPPLEFESFFHIGLLTYCAILQGRQAYTALLRTPSVALSLVQSCSTQTGSMQAGLTQTGLFCLAIFWYEKLVFQARKSRLVAPFNTLSYARGLPGFAETIPFLSQHFYSAETEHLPVFSRKIDDGEWLIGEETWRSDS